MAQNKCWANELVTKQRGAKERGVESYEKTTKDNFVCGRVQARGKYVEPVNERKWLRTSAGPMNSSRNNAALRSAVLSLCQKRWSK
jgi:hypothetical protein